MAKLTGRKFAFSPLRNIQVNMMGIHWILSKYIEVFLVNNHLLIAGTSAGEGGLKKVAEVWKGWRPLLMLRANQAVYVCPPYTEQGLTPRRPPICARHNVHLEPYMDLMHTPFANQLSITYNWSDQCNGTTWVHLLYISIAQYLFHLFYRISEKCHVILVSPIFKESTSFTSRMFLLRCNTSRLFCGFLISCDHICVRPQGGERRMVSTTDSNCSPRLFITSSLHNSSPCKIEQLENVRQFGFPGEFKSPRV